MIFNLSLINAVLWRSLNFMAKNVCLWHVYVVLYQNEQGVIT